MKTISIMLDDELFQSIERTAKRLHVTLTALIQSVLRGALPRPNLQELENRHKRGYAQQPVVPGEFSDWEEEQAWGD